MTLLTLQHKEMPRLRRGGFLLLSLFVHLGFLALWWEDTPLQFGQAENRYAAVALHAVLAPATEDKVTPEPAAQKPRHSERTVPPTQPNKATTPPRHSATPSRRQAGPSSTETQRETTGVSSETDSQRASIEKRALGKIHIELSRHFHYPRQAVRLGWQGEVLLRFRLTSNGRIEAIQVARSSGYSVLDSAAVRALRNVRQIGQVMDHHSDSIDLQLPVIYRLQES